MADIVDKETRSRMMSSIRGKNTKPEIVVRKPLHSEGLRFRFHRKDLPGRPDIVLPKYQTAILVHGFFWHGHDDCHLFRLPRSRTEFWEKKVAGNRARDRRKIRLLHGPDWRTLEIWDCAFKGKLRVSLEPLAEKVTGFLQGASQVEEISSVKQ